MNDRDEEKDFEDLVEMFKTNGWKKFIQDAKDYEKMVQESSVDNAVTGDQWQYCRGQLHQLRSFIAYEHLTMTIHEQQEAEDANTL